MSDQLVGAGYGFFGSARLPDLPGVGVHADTWDGSAGQSRQMADDGVSALRLATANRGPSAGAAQEHGTGTVGALLQAGNLGSVTAGVLRSLEGVSNAIRSHLDVLAGMAGIALAAGAATPAGRLLLTRLRAVFTRTAGALRPLMRKFGDIMRSLAEAVRRRVGTKGAQSPQAASRPMFPQAAEYVNNTVQGAKVSLGNAERVIQERQRLMTRLNSSFDDGTLTADDLAQVPYLRQSPTSHPLYQAERQLDSAQLTANNYNSDMNLAAFNSAKDLHRDLDELMGIEDDLLQWLRRNNGLEPWPA
ncbi:hypothetical protein Misp01_47310 [Microtetraspora sp. NBRC 13810]|uniref:hypothetical protein n=1 Tax=Microtetraspora sp. NBRC 13810 TaxID=3030990 RepID=UPI0024A5682B|nr:hypothetical protein [Microtetraspora sp. NBRC 13810]GLW09602.1 hypothetical protein Misp01_47310 [Microtetraspora sp. NBRC 13810]